MNIRITPRGAPQRTDLYFGVRRVYSTGTDLSLQLRAIVVLLPLEDIAEIAFDDEPGGLD